MWMCRILMTAGLLGSGSADESWEDLEGFTGPILVNKKVKNGLIALRNQACYF